MKYQQAIQVADDARTAFTNTLFLSRAKKVVLYFFAVPTYAQLKKKLSRYGVEMRDTPQDWIDLIHALWHAVDSRADSDRYLAKKLVDRMFEEEWWATDETAIILQEKICLIFNGAKVRQANK